MKKPTFLAPLWVCAKIKLLFVWSEGIILRILQESETKGGFIEDAGSKNGSATVAFRRNEDNLAMAKSNLVSLPTFPC